MAKYFCIARVEGGKIQNPKAIKTLIEALKDGKYKFEISSLNTRSLSQNSYYWLILTDYIQPALYNAGWADIKTKEAAHEFVADLFLKVKIINENTLEEKIRVKSTTELNKEDFNIYLEDIRRWSSEYLSTVVPEPNQQFVLYE